MLILPIMASIIRRTLVLKPRYPNAISELRVHGNCSFQSHKKLLIVTKHTSAFNGEYEKVMRIIQKCFALNRTPKCDNELQIKNDNCKKCEKIIEQIFGKSQNNIGKINETAASAKINALEKKINKKDEIVKNEINLGDKSKSETTSKELESPDKCEKIINKIFEKSKNNLSEINKRNKEEKNIDKKDAIKKDKFAKNEIKLDRSELSTKVLEDEFADIKLDGFAKMELTQQNYKTAFYNNPKKIEPMIATMGTTIPSHQGQQNVTASEIAISSPDLISNSVSLNQMLKIIREKNAMSQNKHCFFKAKFSSECNPPTRVNCPPNHCPPASTPKCPPPRKPQQPCCPPTPPSEPKSPHCNPHPEPKPACPPHGPRPQRHSPCNHPPSCPPPRKTPSTPCHSKLNIPPLPKAPSRSPFPCPPPRRYND